MSRTRDLSGFGTPKEPVAPAPATDATPKPPVKKRRTKPKGTSPTSGQSRITLSLPTSTAHDLKAATLRDETFYLDIILNAFLDHADTLRLDETQTRMIGDMVVSRPRRRLPPGRTQIPLNIPKTALTELDRSAKELGLNRSEYVVALLELAL